MTTGQVKGRGGWMSRPGLSVAERNRIRELVMAIDVAPRIALVLMLGRLQPCPRLGRAVARFGPAGPVARGYGLKRRPLLWVHVAHGDVAVGAVLRADLALRVLILVGMLVLGVRGLSADSSVPGWLAVKFLLFAAIIGDGIVLRWISGQWRPAIQRLEAGDTAIGEELLRVRRQKAIVAALLMWLLVGGAALIGTLKP